MPTKICAWCGQPFTTHVHQTLQMAGVFGRNSQREHSTSDSLPPTPKEVQVLSQLALIAKTARRQKTEMCTRKGHAYRGQSEHAAPPVRDELVAPSTTRVSKTVPPVAGQDNQTTPQSHCGAITGPRPLGQPTASHQQLYCARHRAANTPAIETDELA